MKTFLLIFMPLLIIAAGCASVETGTTIYGTSCRALNERQIARLIRFSRKALKRNSGKYKITAGEQHIIETTYPELRAEYRGDCYGTLHISWETPGRRIGMRIENDLNAEIPSCALAITSSDGKHSGSIMPNKTIRGR